MSSYPEDNDFETHIITEVTGDDTHWTVRTKESSLLSFEKVKGATPAPGSTMRVYPRGLGSSVRGIFIDGNKVYYRTPEEQAERHKQWFADNKAKKAAEALKNAPEVDARVAKLPQPFQDRISGFRKRNPEFQAEYESYELFCCEQAVVLATTLKSADAIGAFSKADYDDQRAQVPGLDDGHSGNTLGMSIRLAHFFVSDQNDTIRKFHGAFCPITGCEKLGCWASSEEAKAELAAKEAQESKDG